MAKSKDRKIIKEFKYTYGGAYVTATLLEGYRYGIYFMNGKYLGNTFPDVNGFYYYWPNNEGGCWSSLSMKLVAGLLDKMNRLYEKELEAYFKGQISFDEDQEDPSAPDQHQSIQ